MGSLHSAAYELYVLTHVMPQHFDPFFFFSLKCPGVKPLVIKFSL